MSKRYVLITALGVILIVVSITVAFLLPPRSNQKSSAVASATVNESADTALPETIADEALNPTPTIIPYSPTPTPFPTSGPGVDGHYSRAAEDHVHEYISYPVEATCAEGGYIQHTCTLCGYGYRTEKTAALDNHTFEKIDQIKATYEHGGYDLWRCTVCGKEEHRNITDALVKIFSVSDASKAGDLYASKLGMNVDANLTPDNSHWRTPTAIPFKEVNANGGETYLHGRIARLIDQHRDDEIAYGLGVSDMIIHVYVTTDAASASYLVYLLCG